MYFSGLMELTVVGTVQLVIFYGGEGEYGKAVLAAAPLAPGVLRKGKELLPKKGTNLADDTVRLPEQISGPGERLAGQIKAVAKKRPFAERLKDILANPEKWKVVKMVSEESSNIRNRGGQSIQELLVNKETGETLVRHTLLKPDGKLFEPPHYRDYWK